MRLDAQAAADAVQRRIGAPLGLGAGEAAWGIHTLANANMERAMRIVSIERGRDPRKYALVAFGGAGPLHAARLALALGIPKIIVPFGAGVGSAIGMLEADAKLDASMTHVLKLIAGSRAPDRRHLRPARRPACNIDLQRMGSAVAPTLRPASPICATPARATRSASTCRISPCAPTMRRRSRPASRRPTRRSTAIARPGPWWRPWTGTSSPPSPTPPRERIAPGAGRDRHRRSSAAARARPTSPSSGITSTAPSSTAAPCPSAK